MACYRAGTRQRIGSFTRINGLETDSALRLDRHSFIAFRDWSSEIREVKRGPGRNHGILRLASVLLYGTAWERAA